MLVSGIFCALILQKKQDLSLRRKVCHEVEVQIKIKIVLLHVL
jgi:hypothetical protein